MSGPDILGVLTDQEVANFQQRLNAAQLLWDLRAAERASRVTIQHHQDEFGWLIENVVRGTPSGDQMNAVRQDAAGTATQSTPDALQAVVDALESLISAPESTSPITLVFLDDTGASQWVWIAGTDGYPHAATGGPGHISWESHIPNLHAEERVQRFQLAGGCGHMPIDWVDAAVGIEESVQQVLQGRKAGPVLVLNRISGWEVSSRFENHIRGVLGEVVTMHDVADSDVDFQQLVNKALRRVPVTEEYRLVAASIKASGSVEVEYIPLQFVAPRQGEGPPTATVSVYLPPLASRTLMLPVLMRRKESDEWHTAVVGSVAIARALEPDAGVQIRIVRDAPGSIRVLAPANVTEETTTWDSIVRTVPPRLDLSAGVPFDLVCAIEMSGDSSIVQSRIDLLSATLSAIDEVESAGDRLRVSLLGYHDHPNSAINQTEPDTPVVRMSPASIESAIETLRSWEPSLQLDTSVTSVEDMLHELQSIQWRIPSEKVLLTFGSRPPHPFKQMAEWTPVCPHRRNWEEGLAFSPQLQLRRVAVVDRPSNLNDESTPASLRQRYEKTWSVLGANDRLDLDSCEVNSLVKTIRGGRQQTPELPLFSVRPVYAIYGGSI